MLTKDQFQKLKRGDVLKFDSGVNRIVLYPPTAQYVILNRLQRLGVNGQMGVVYEWSDIKNKCSLPDSVRAY